VVWGPSGGSLGSSPVEAPAVYRSRGAGLRTGARWAKRGSVMNTLLHYPTCSTCRKARTWLGGRGIDVALVDLVATPPTAAALADLHRRSGLPLKAFFNVSGVSYRAGGWKDRIAALSEAELLAALAADGKLIKRPILDLGHSVLVGFAEDAWSRAVGGP
jgi:arsenate reductase